MVAIFLLIKSEYSSPILCCLHEVKFCEIVCCPATTYSISSQGQATVHKRKEYVVEQKKTSFSSQPNPPWHSTCPLSFLHSFFIFCYAIHRFFPPPIPWFEAPLDFIALFWVIHSSAFKQPGLQLCDFWISVLKARKEGWVKDQLNFRLLIQADY